MKVLYAASEAAPFFKSGGLGDVAYALPKELHKQGVDIRVVLPKYADLPKKYAKNLEHLTSFAISMGGYRKKFVGVEKLVLDDIIYYFIDNMEYFDRPGLYGYEDDEERFAYFSMAVIEMMEKINFIPNVIHVNDWQTAMIPALLVDKYNWIENYRQVRKVITIHNIRFQGKVPPEYLSEIFGIGANIYHENGARQYDHLNFLKAGINYSDVITTVSPSYALEIQTPEFGEGLDGVLRHNSWKLRGIINGIDYESNNPETDPRLPNHYSRNKLSGKEKNKEALQECLNLPVDPDIPILSVVSRLTDQKGMQLLQEKAEELVHTKNVQVVVLGTGEEQFENSFRYFDWKYPEKFHAVIDFDTTLAQLIYAGSDIFLMPSAFEPCGLSQMIALRHGTVPIVHETGGLKDTVVPYNVYTGEGTGFSFNIFDGYHFLGAIYRALDVYENTPKAWNDLVRRGMEVDFSWEEPAKEYIKIYRGLLD